jgi:hypothetical protein
MAAFSCEQKNTGAFIGKKINVTTERDPLQSSSDCRGTRSCNNPVARSLGRPPIRHIRDARFTGLHQYDATTRPSPALVVPPRPASPSLPAALYTPFAARARRATRRRRFPTSPSLPCSLLQRSVRSFPRRASSSPAVSFFPSQVRVSPGARARPARRRYLLVHILFRFLFG